MTDKFDDLPEYAEAIFTASDTPRDALPRKWGRTWDKARCAEYHILFAEDEYVAALLPGGR